MEKLTHANVIFGERSPGYVVREKASGKPKQHLFLRPAPTLAPLYHGTGRIVYKRNTKDLTAGTRRVKNPDEPP